MKNLLSIFFVFIFFVSAQAQSTQLWTTCSDGGAQGNGAIIKAGASGTNFQVAYSFDGTNGAYPIGNLCEGGNGKLYGVTKYGGFADSCVCYSYDTATSTYFKLHDLEFDPVDSGYGAESGMFRASDGMLYGMTSGGGIYLEGVIYRVDPSIDSYSPVYHFSPATGSSPRGEFIQLADGKLYGMTSIDGQNGYGVIFSFDPSDSTYTDLYDFNGSTGGYPYYGKLLLANSGELYGLTSSGGSYNGGVLFSYDLVNNTYTDLHDFNPSTEGYGPRGSLIQAQNGLLYGITYLADSGYGSIFSFDISTQVYSTLFYLNDSTGGNPAGSLAEGSNGKLLGTIPGGSYYWAGSAFSFDINNNEFTELFDFSDIGCSHSYSDILITEAGDATPVPIINNIREQFQITPNPATDQIIISGKQLNSKTQVSMCDGHGNSVTGFTVNGNELNISKLPSGIYLVSITEGNSILSRKFVKE